MQTLVMKNTTVALNQEEYKAETQRIEKRYNAAMARATALEGKLAERKRRSKEIWAFIMMLSTQPRPHEMGRAGLDHLVRYGDRSG